MIRLILLILILSPLIFSHAQTDLRYIYFSSINTEHWLFNSLSDTLIGIWSYITPLPQPLYGVNTYYYTDSNKIFICAGTKGASQNQTTCYFYNPVNGQYEIDFDGKNYPSGIYFYILPVGNFSNSKKMLLLK